MLSRSNVRLKSSLGVPCGSADVFAPNVEGRAWPNVWRSLSGLYWKAKKTFFEEIDASFALGASRIRVPLLMLDWLGKCLHPTVAVLCFFGFSHSGVSFPALMLKGYALYGDCVFSRIQFRQGNVL